MLSKSQFIRGLQCHKSLWLHKRKPELRATINQSKEILFKTGRDVGDFAKNIFPGGEEIIFDPTNFNGMIKKTDEAISNGAETLYEATFKENGVFAMADILNNNR